MTLKTPPDIVRTSRAFMDGGWRKYFVIDHKIKRSDLEARRQQLREKSTKK